MGQKIVAGLLAGLILASVFILYYLVRGRAFVATMKRSSPEMANTSDAALFFMFLGAFIFAALLLGLSIRLPPLSLILQAAILARQIKHESATHISLDGALQNLAFEFLIQSC